MSDSVGKITLDLEVTTDLEKQIGTVSGRIAQSLKGNLGNATKGIMSGLQTGINKSISGINKVVAASANKARKSFSDATNAIKNASVSSSANSRVSSPTGATRQVGISNQEELTTQISGLEKTLDNVNARIENQKAKLAELREAYNSAFSETRKNKIEEQMLRTENTINRLTSQSNRLGFRLSDLDARLNNTGTSANNASRGLNNTSQGSKKATKNVSLLRRALDKAKSSLSSMSKSASNAGDTLIKKLKKLYKYAMALIGIKIGMKGIRALGKELRETLSTNQQLMTSLNQVKSNLLIAFMPIYNYVLPALNALMSGLARLTAMLASLVSSLFGTTYKASSAAAQSLIDAKEAMGLYGDSASDAADKTKEAQNALAGFDEINQLNANDDSDDSDSSSSVPTLDTSTFDDSMQSWADGIKEKLKTLFSPLIAAWQNEGQKTIDSMKYALSSVWDLIKSIGKSFAEVWLNGTGQQTCELILQIFQNIFNLIGDIASALDNAWNRNNIGTQTVQNIWDAFNNVLSIVKGVGDALREVFDNIGQSVADHFVGVLNSLSKLILYISDCLKRIWDNGGKYAFEKIIEFGGRVWNVLSDIITDCVEPIAEFLASVLTPIIEDVLKVVGWLFDKINNFLSWLDGDGRGILDGFGDVLTSLGTAFLAVKAGIAIFEELKKVIGGIQTAFSLLSSAFAFFTSPVGIVVLCIGAIILIGYELVKHWDELKTKAVEVWDGIKAKFQEFKDWLGNVFATDWTTKFGAFGMVINDFFRNVSGIWNSLKEVFKGIIDFVAGAFSGDWSRAWNGVKEIFRGIFDGLATIVKTPINAIIALINGAINGLNTLIKGANKLPSVNIPTIGKVPYLAKGGIVDSPTLAMVGEAGKEAVMPLENNTGWISNLAGQIAGQLNGNSGGDSSASKQPAQLNIYLDGVLSAQKIIDDINNMTKANGGVCPINV